MKTLIPGIAAVAMGVQALIWSARDSRSAVAWDYRILGLRLDEKRYRTALRLLGLLFVGVGIWMLRVTDMRLLFGTLLTLFGATRAAFSRQDAHSAVQFYSRMLGARFKAEWYNMPFLVGGLIFMAWGLLMLFHLIGFQGSP